MAALVIEELRLIEAGEMFTAPTAETLAVGDAARYDTSALLTGANGTDSTENNFQGLVLEIDAGQIATIAGNDCLVTLGDALAAVAYGALIYLSDTDKKLTPTSGESTTTKVFGKVEAVRNQSTVYKALRIRQEVA
jgi:hypothetical protein